MTPPLTRPFLVAGAVLLAGSSLPAVAVADAPAVTIPEIHGSTFRSPYDGDRVTDVAGTVTAVSDTGSGRGFWFQDTAAQGPGSKGLFVFTGRTTPNVTPGDDVLVDGTVDDYYPDAPPAESVLLALTELTDATWTVRSSGNPLPRPLVLDENSVPRRIAADTGGKSIEDAPLRPERYAMDFYESHESELVAVTDAQVVGPTNDYDEMFVTTRPRHNPTSRGGTVYRDYADPNTGRLLVSALPRSGGAELPVADVGDRLAGVTSGPLGYSEFGGYQLLAERVGALRPGGTEQETTRAQRDRELATATYNVENLAATDPQSTFDRLARGVVTNLASPDILSLEEIQDNDGATDSGVVAADETLRRFTEAIAAAGGPRYAWRQIDPEYNADGGEPNGNIRVAFLYNPKRVSFVDRKAGDATTPTGVRGIGPFTRLTHSPGRIDPANEAWAESRKPLAGEFAFRGRRVFVIANHFSSKGGDQPLSGRYQPPARSSEKQRTAQAEAVHAFVTKLTRANPLANVVVLGDLNDYQFSPTLRTLTGGGTLRALMDTLPPAERYSYVYEGNSQALDHILTSRAILRPDYDVVHINAEFADQASDHDPQVLRFVPLF